jgi:hypothetical protein
MQRITEAHLQAKIDRLNKITVTRQDGTYCESMRFASLVDARAWAQWQEQNGRVAHINPIE